MFVALVGVGAVAMGMTAGYFLRGARRAEAPVVHRCRCPRCGQKVRYAACRASRDAMCPRCLRRFSLPSTPQPLAEPAVVGRTYRRGLALRRTA
jgi:hypothetical protein